MSYDNQQDPNVGFDYSKLPKNYIDSEYDELPDARGGWKFQSVGRIAILIYMVALVLCIVLNGTSANNLIPNTVLIIGGLAISLVPLIPGIIGLFRKAGRWWALVTVLASIILNPFFLSIVFIAFAEVVIL